MKAVILAAGDGERLAPITQTLPKALLPIAGETVISRLIRQLADHGVRDLCIVIGYEGSRLADHARESAAQRGVKVTFVTNEAYQETKTAFSALLAAPWVSSDPFLLIDGDLVASDALVAMLIDHGGTALAYEAKAITGPEEMKVRLSRSAGRHNTVVELGKGISAASDTGEFVGIVAFDEASSNRFFEALESLPVTELRDAYYERGMNALAADGVIEALPVEHGSWIEIDFVTDYLQALSLFGGQVHPMPGTVSEQILLCPGPVMVSPRVKRALLHEDVGHRETEFIEILTRTRGKLLRAFGVGPHSDYTDVILTGSGTAANEALISSYFVGKRVAILANGEFGLRLIDLARCHQIDVTSIDFGWGKPFDLDVVESQLNAGRFDVLMMVHHETSTGMLNPVLEVGKLCERYNVRLCVDAVSSIGAEKLLIEEANVTFCTASANKAVACLPGLSFVCGKREAFESLRENAARTRYLDLERHYRFEEKLYQTPNTPAVSLFFALEAALDELLEDTLEHRMNHYGQLAANVRDGFRRLGWRFVIPEPAMSRVLTTIYYPDQLDVEGFHQWVKRHNYVIYRGKGPLLGKAFQVANIGHVRASHVDGFLNAVESLVEDPKRTLREVEER